MLLGQIRYIRKREMENDIPATQDAIVEENKKLNKDAVENRCSTI